MTASSRRGPHTPEGKAKVSRNALKHGQRAEKHFVLKHENTADLEALCRAVRAEFGTVGDFENNLADVIALCQFRNKRSARVEVSVMDYTFDQTLTGGVGYYTDEQRLQRAEIATINNDWLPSSDRYESANDRRIRRAVQDLRAHQASRQTRLPLAPGGYHLSVPLAAFAPPAVDVDAAPQIADDFPEEEELRSTQKDGEVPKHA